MKRLFTGKQITGEPVAVKKALFAISAIMYKFGPKENISLDTSVPEGPPTIIIPSDVPVYPAAGLYPGVDSIIDPRSLSSILGATHVPELAGYADTGRSWPAYSSSVPVVSHYGGASRSEELIIRVLCSFSKIGRVIGKGGASVKSVRKASGARVDVDDKKTDRNECTITVTATEVYGLYLQFKILCSQLIISIVLDLREEQSNLLLPIISFIVPFNATDFHLFHLRTCAHILLDASYVIADLTNS